LNLKIGKKISKINNFLQKSAKSREKISKIGKNFKNQEFSPKIGKNFKNREFSA
jgi:hypothetical protein